MTPTKKTVAKKGDKSLKMDNSKFRSLQHFERYTQFYLKAPIIQERFVDLADLKDTFIPGCFEGRGWEKLLSNLPGVLGFEGMDDHDFTNYKDRMLSIETAQAHIGGVKEGKCLNTNAFPADMRCLTVIMMFNLYLVRKLTTINNARAIFLMELKKKTFIDINEEEGGDQEGGEGMETETEAAGQPSSSRGRSKRSRASSSLEIPPDAFQIILEKIDGLRDMQNEQNDKLSALQDQMNILSSKLDSFFTQQ
ncbi:hypothetical protein SO802_009979 [Lithocarpus litseifolius]|uniref:Uncharacterized protein n=1 Tax=Lithocarpus litseifolius TaxID=425828 RepID=A0AAW2DF63_9ROSI